MLLQKILALSLICLVVFVASPMIARAQVTNTPESRVKDFYTWYLKAKVGNKNPAKNKQVMNSYVSKRFSRWFYSRGVKDLESGVFFNRDDWRKAWADNIQVDEAVFLSDENAALHVALSSPPDEFVMKLQVILVLEGGKWKIDRVAGYFD
jgi:hypothetical protein